METRDVVIVGGGPAGLAAAVELYKKGIRNVLIVEREKTMGGILRQCIHDGFGLTRFGETLSGPEYAQKFIDEVMELKIPYVTDTTVLSVSPDKIVTLASSNGLKKIQAKAVILTMGCRERTRGALGIPGERPTGVFTAGVAQAYINLYNRMVGKEVVILGSGDIGMIMARRMTLEGAHVIAVVELMDFLAGLTRNKVQCLDDFGIPLKLSHTVTRIVGNERVEGVYIAQVDKDKKPIPETEEFIPCDTLLLSVGLIPENELSRGADVKISRITNGPEVNQYMQTSWDNVFACGNVVHVNDLVDNVTVESMNAGASAARYAMHKLPEANREVPSVTGENVRYLCPQRVKIGEENETVRLFFRVLHPELDVVIRVKSGDKVLSEKKAKRVNPGEMCHVEVKTAEITGDDVTVEVVK